MSESHAARRPNHPDSLIDATRHLLRFFAYATGAVALWLLSVIVFVLPSQDPTSIPVWIVITMGFSTFSGLSLWHLHDQGDRRRRSALVVVAVLAVAFGLFQVASMIAPSNGDFEGYLLLMGLILTSHGITALAQTFLNRAG